MFDQWRKVTLFGPIPKISRVFFSCCIWARARLGNLRKNPIICWKRFRCAVLKTNSPISCLIKGTSSSIFPIICPRPARCAPNRFGICLDLHRPWNVAVSVNLYSLTCYKTYKTVFFTGCRIKIHKDHLERKEDNVSPCKLHYDPSYAKELLLLASTIEEQRQWVTRLSRKIQKCGFKANNSNSDTSKISPRWVSH